MGKNMLTACVSIFYIGGMKTNHSLKRGNLREAGLLNSDPDRIRDPLFREHPEFFDACDSLQVRYEMLRAHLVDGHRVAGICERFGISRQTFYSLEARLIEQGTAGLLPRKPGPKGPWKLTAEVLGFAKQQVEATPQIAAWQLSSALESGLGVSLHRRTVEKLLKDLGAKKNV